MWKDQFSLNHFSCKLLVSLLHPPFSRVCPWIPKVFQPYRSKRKWFAAKPIDFTLCSKPLGIRIFILLKMKVSCHVMSCHVTLLKILIEMTKSSALRKPNVRKNCVLEMSRISFVHCLWGHVTHSLLRLWERAGLPVSLWNIDDSHLLFHCLGLTSSNGIQGVDNRGDPHRHKGC